MMRSRAPAATPSPTETPNDAASHARPTSTGGGSALTQTTAIPTAIRLNASRLARLPANVQVPLYDRGAVTPSIVHIGVGGFHRAHQAVYLDDLLHQPGNAGWGLCGVGLL